MNKAIRELKTNTKLYLVCFLILAAVIGLYGFNKNDNTTSFDNAADSVIVVKQEPQIEIQKQRLVEEIQPTESREKYIVRSGDNMSKIATKFKHKNVEYSDYHSVLIKINSGHKLQIGQELELPSDEDLKDVILPEIDILFSIHDEEFIQSIKHSEGSSVIQSKLTRKLINGKGAPFKNNKFYPYRDSNGNFTIGYGHYLGKDIANAHKYANGITKYQATVILKNDMKSILKDFELLLRQKRATNLTDVQQMILFEMAFTMGTAKLSKFKKMWNSTHDHDMFISEIKRSLWYRQVGDRADRILGLDS